MKFQLAAFADEVNTDLEQQITAMKENDIWGLEIRGVNGQSISDITNETAKEIRERLDEEGLSCWALGSPYGKYELEKDFTPHLDKFCHGLELARILGATHIRLFSFFLPKGVNPSDCREEVLERLGKFIEKARGSGIVLCHENEKGIYGETAPRCLEIHKALPELKAVFDPSNFIHGGQDTKESWDLLSPYVEYMHIKDARADGLVVPAGEGIGNLPYLLSQYKGKVLTIEPHLTVFEGLADLERKGERTKINEFCYPSRRAAFDAAVNALKKLIEQ